MFNIDCKGICSSPKSCCSCGNLRVINKRRRHGISVRLTSRYIWFGWGTDKICQDIGRVKPGQKPFVHSVPARSEPGNATKIEAMPSEKETRADLIDTQLRQAGWAVDNPTQVLQELRIESPGILPAGEPLTGETGVQFSDYVLLGKNGKPLAVVKAKKTSKDPAIGRVQAKQYRGLRGCRGRRNCVDSQKLS